MKLSKEEVIQRDCVDFVHKCCPGVVIIASLNKITPASGNMGPFFAFLAKMKLIGLYPGEGDLRLHWNPGKTAYIELKAPPNKPKPDQLTFMQTMRDIGFYCDWANSLDGFIAHLKAAGVPMRARYT